MNYNDEVTAEYAMECLNYDPETGLFTWKHRPREHFKTQKDYNAWNSRYAGKKTGWISKQNGYANIQINKIKYRAHRIAWLIFYGKWPNDTIDHIDGICSNNKISNLRDVPLSHNVKNKSINISNTTGYLGVYFVKEGTWIATIRSNNKSKHLGTFKTIDEAIEARKVAEKEHNFHPNHGREKHYGK